MKTSLSEKVSEKDSSVESALLKCVSYPFNILGYQIVHGTYIANPFKKEGVVHNLSSLLKTYRGDIGQLNEIEFIETFSECFFYTYQCQDVSEYDEHIIKFYTKDLNLLYIYKGNFIGA